MKRDREGVEAAAIQEQEHPPPPSRKPPANGTASARSSISAHTTRNFGRTPANSLGPPSGSSSYSHSISSKKPRHGLDPRASLRASAVVVSSRPATAPAPAPPTVAERKGRKVENGGVSNKGGGAVKEQGGEGAMIGRAGPSVKSQRKFAAVCSANFNRSMMAHKLLQENNFHVQSFGTGRDVRLPGKDINSPEVFAFGTPYRYILDSLKSKDEEFFRKNKLLGLVARNAEIKTAPQRFQEIEGSEVAEFDVVLCFDSRVFYLVVEAREKTKPVFPRELKIQTRREMPMLPSPVTETWPCPIGESSPDKPDGSRDPETFKPLHVVNMTIKDSPEEAEAAANDVLFLCRTLDGVSQLEEEAAGVLDNFTKKTKRTILHQVCHV